MAAPPGSPPPRQHVAHRRLGRFPPGATTIAGSRLPCSAVRAGTRVAGHVEGRPPVDADHVGAGARPSGPHNSPVLTPKWMRGHAEVRDGGEHLGAGRRARSVRSRRATARRPTSRTAARAEAPASTWERSDAMARSARRSISSSQSDSSVSMRALVRMYVRDGPALEQVARHGERRPCEARSGGRRQLGDEVADGLEHVGRVDVRFERAAAVPRSPRPRKGRSARPDRRRARCRPRSRSRGPGS